MGPDSLLGSRPRYVANGERPGAPRCRLLCQALVTGCTLWRERIARAGLPTTRNDQRHASGSVPRTRFPEPRNGSPRIFFLPLRRRWLDILRLIGVRIAVVRQVGIEELA